jgi:aspartyl-tRNA(Asn)/glutamyl-tRNA(Gln) amidotransferase subunit A
VTAQVERALECIERWQPVTNAFSQIFADEARKEAGPALTGPLAGVPIGVKDLFDVAGRETTGCCEAYRGNVAERDAEVVTRLRRAGAVLVGKCNQHELAFGTTNLISACGPAHNPFDAERITGGSSGGSAAAVASRCVRFALGTDTGGSIRIPAAFCGVFGLKPTHGRLPLDGVMPLAASLDCPGPIAATADDLALAWRVLSGDTITSSPATGVAVVGTDRCTDHVHEAIEATAAALGRLGATATLVPDELRDAPFAWVEVAAPETFRDHGALLDRRDLVHPVIASFIEYGSKQQPERLVEGRAQARDARRWFDEQLERADVVLMPATPYPAPRADDDEIETRDGGRIDVHVGGPSTFTRAVNLAGLPSLAMPAGRTGDGLPVGVQLVGRPGSEPVLLATAAALERLEDRFTSPAPPDP